MSRENRFSRHFALCVFVVFATGCGGAGGAGSRSIYTFPDPADLQALANSGHLDVREFEPDVVFAGSWQPSAPDEPLEDSSEFGELPWESFLREMSAARGQHIAPTPEMQCAARQLGIFMLEHGQRPDETLRRYMAAVCGSTEARVNLSGLTSSSLATTSLDDVLNDVRDELRRYFMRAPGSRSLTTGSWVGRLENRVVVAIATGAVDARLGSIAQVATHGESVEIRGELVSDAETIVALVNLGELGVGRCSRERDSELPHFRSAVLSTEETLKRSFKSRFGGLVDISWTWSRRCSSLEKGSNHANGYGRQVRAAGAQSLTLRNSLG